jgi:heterodisulfide reductase subunit A
MEKLGIRPERLQMEWCSAAESARWVTIMTAVEDLRKKVTAKEIADTKRILREQRIKAEKAKAAKAKKEAEETVGAKA